MLVLMGADKRGEGGILALLALIVGESAKGQAGERRSRWWIMLALAGTAMLCVAAGFLRG